MRGGHTFRQLTAAPEPQRIDRALALAHALLVPRMLVQHHLRFGQQGAPAAAGIAFGQMGEQIIAEHFIRLGKGWQGRARRKTQVPARRHRGIEHETEPGKQRLQRRQQVHGIGQVGAQGIPVPHQAGAVHVRHHVRRIGPQPDRAAGIANIELAGQGCGGPRVRLRLEMPTQLGALARIGTAAFGTPQRLGDVIGQRRRRKPAARRQQQRRRGHRGQSRYWTLTISYSRWPAGASMVTASPSSLPIRARASGEEIAIRPSLMSASRSPTIW